MHNKSLMVSRIHKLRYFLWIMAICFHSLKGQPIALSIKNINQLTQQISFTFSLAKKDFIYKDFLSFSVADPDITLSEWHSTSIPEYYYDPLFKNTKQIFRNTFTIVITATTQTVPKNTDIYCTYYQRSEKNIRQITFPLVFSDTTTNSTPHISTNTHLEIESSCPITHTYQQSPLHAYFTMITTTISYIHDIDTYGTHIFLIVLLIFFTLIPPYFFRKKRCSSAQLYELTTTIAETSWIILIGYIIHHANTHGTHNLTTLLIPLYTFTSGIFYIKKSTKTQWIYLRTLCTLLAYVLLAISVLLAYKVMQTFYPI